MLFRSATAKQIADAVGVTTPYVYAVQHKQRAKQLTKFQERAKQLTASQEDKPTAFENLWEQVEPVTNDNVNHPAHYKTGGIETIDFIEAKGLN